MNVLQRISGTWTSLRHRIGLSPKPLPTGADIEAATPNPHLQSEYNEWPLGNYYPVDKAIVAALSGKPAAQFLHQTPSHLRSAVRDGTYRSEDFLADLKRLEKSGIGGVDGYYADWMLKSFPGLGADFGKQGDSWGFRGSNLEDVFGAMKHIPMSKETVVYEVGCGRAKPSLLFGWLSGAQVVGVERDQKLAEHAKQTVSEMGLTNVQVVQADAFQVDYQKADVFYMYAPFTDNTLDKWLDEKLQPVARSKPVHVVWVGPSAQQLATKPYLKLQTVLETKYEPAYIFTSTQPRSE